jgi:hypothetical protein
MDKEELIALLHRLNSKTEGGSWFVEHGATKDGQSRIDDGRHHGMHPIYGEAYDIEFAAACVNYVRRFVIEEGTMKQSDEVAILRIKAQIAKIENEIKAYPHWGAKLTALDEERRGLLRTLERLTGGR